MEPVVSDSPGATRAIAAVVADLTVAGDLLVLCGDLGAGKTAFTQGFGAALGIVDRITSPTFTIHAVYEGRLTLNHLDVYRFDQIDEVADLGLSELLDGTSVTVIEWGDTIIPALPRDYLEISIGFPELDSADSDGSDEGRVLMFRCVGSRWSAREGSLGAALATVSGRQIQC
ncbi:MAG: tRNA (adenosine(37)-N6)-threonylcarbamoyltransferase complex ATPase subunit type 1 TsaE [Actinomycetia bacterium]|nr:tRNA (adenosine(37)-N6)-threonylcarbamoyltransferase complex ATPase subunit type 1 TsaE [Actinomycetes bacterium]